MAKVNILPGLPPYGPRAISFPTPNAFREGLVVEFVPEHGEHWVGNFESSFGTLNAVHTELGPASTIVIAGGAGYVVDTEGRSLVRALTGLITQFLYDSQVEMAIITNGLWFEAFDTHGMKWQTPRLSWDGVKNVHLTDGIITGEAFSPGDFWHPFWINITSGMISGGSYNGP